MIASPGQTQRRVWSIWVAAGLAALGGVMPLLFGGTSSRIADVIIPFWIAAIALAAVGLLNTQSRTVLSVIYFVAGLAIVYGLLSMFSLPIRLAVLGSCAAPPAPCSAGLSRPLTDGENTGMGAAAALGILALFMGFYGLMTILRGAVIPQVAPRARTIPPVASSRTAEPVPVAAAVGTANEAEPPELPAHDEEELPELPPHESSSGTT